MEKTLKKASTSNLTWVVILLILATSFSSYFHVSAQDNLQGISMRVWAAFGGNFKYGEWLPVIIELENSGEDVDAEVRIRIASGNQPTTYVQPAQLPTQSRKRIVIYVVPNNFSREIEAQLVAGDQLLISEKANVSPHPPINYNIGLITPERGPLALLETVKLPGQERDKNLIDLTIEELPEIYEPLRSFDLLVINDSDTASFTPNQAIALDTWVRRGGRLVIGGGPGAQRTLQNLPDSLVPVSIEERDQPEILSGLEDYLFGEYPILVPGPFAIETGTSINAFPLASQENLALILEMPVGDGFVNYVALDLTSTPFNAWNGTVHFWEKLIASGAAYPDWQPPDYSARQQILGQIPYALSNLPILDLPSVQGLSFLLVFYIILIGPVNYFLLRWRKRLHWAWITIPLITFMFSCFAFGLGYFLHGDDMFANKIAIIQLQTNGKAHVNSFLGIFSPGQRAYEIEVSEGLVSPLDAYVDPWNSFTSPPNVNNARELRITQGKPNFIQGFSVDQWSMQSFMAEGINIDFGHLKTELYLENDQLVGEIQNDSNYSIKDLAIAINKQVKYLGSLAPGKSTNIEIVLTNEMEPNYGPPISYRILEVMRSNTNTIESDRQFETQRIIIESIMEQNKGSAFSSLAEPGGNVGLAGVPILIGWVDEAPPDIIIEGQPPNQQTTALVYTQLPYSLPESGVISLPIGMIPGKLSGIPSFGGPCGEPGASAVFLDRGEALFEFQIPYELLQTDIQTLKLGLWNDSGLSDFPLFELYNWETGDWIELEVHQGINPFTDASQVVRTDGVVHVRLVRPMDQPQRGACYYISMGLETFR